MIIRELYVSPGHNWFGHHGRPPDAHAMEAVETVECVAGRGLRGDRFFGYRPDYKGQVTLFAAEVWQAAAAHFGRAELPAWAFRRNVIVAGQPDLLALAGERFVLQGVTLEGTEECRPCYWMEQAVAPGAEAWLRGRGGLRCRILTDGWWRREG